MARRPSRMSPDFITDPIDDAVSQDRESIADALTETLEALGSVDQGSIRGILYRIPVPNGKYEWIRDVYPPFDMSEIMRSLKDDIGGGDYALRIMAEGKVRKTLHFAIMKDKVPLIAKNDSGDMMTMFQMWMAMQNSNAAASQAAADRQMTMMMNANQQSTQMMLGMVTAMTSGREKMSDVIPLFAAMKPDPVPTNSMKDTLETLEAFKGLVGSGDGGSGFDADDIVGSVLKVAGPIAGAVGRAINDRRAHPTAEESPQPREVAQPLMLPQTVDRQVQETMGEAVREPSKYPILDLIRDDVLFMFKRNHDPARAADVVYDTIDAHAVEGSQIDELVAAFAVSPSWLDDLASEGIDLRTNPQWADEFISALVAIHAEALGADDHSGGHGGSETDTATDAPASPRRVKVNGGQAAGG